MNLYHLKTFYYTARYKSLTKAADVLCITQPAVTKQIKQLQGHYEIKFLDIIGKKVVLTDSGKHLYSIAEKIFDMENQAEESIRDFQNFTKGEINILSCESFGAYYVPYIIRYYNITNPDIKISMQIRRNDDIVDDIAGLNNDIGFLSKSVYDNPKISINEILEDDIVFIASPEYPLSRRDLLVIDDLKGCNMIVHEKGSVTRKVADNLIRKYNIDLNISYEISNSEAIKKLVQQNLGVAFISKNMVNEEIKSSKLLAVPVEEEDFKRKYYMIHHSEKYFSKPIKDLFDLVLQWSKIYPTPMF